MGTAGALMTIILRARARSLIEAKNAVVCVQDSAEFCERALAASLKQGICQLVFLAVHQFCERALAASLKLSRAQPVRRWRPQFCERALAASLKR